MAVETVGHLGRQRREAAGLGSEAEGDDEDGAVGVDGGDGGEVKEAGAVRGG